MQKFILAVLLLLTSAVWVFYPASTAKADNARTVVVLDGRPAYLDSFNQPNKPVEYVDQETSTQPVIETTAPTYSTVEVVLNTKADATATPLDSVLADFRLKPNQQPTTAKLVGPRRDYNRSWVYLNGVLIYEDTRLTTQERVPDEDPAYLQCRTCRVGNCSTGNCYSGH